MACEFFTRIYMSFHVDRWLVNSSQEYPVSVVVTCLETSLGHTLLLRCSNDLPDNAFCNIVI